MAASTRHVLTNVERMAGDDELLKLWNREAKAKNDDDTARTIQQAWVAFVQAADEVKIADRIPGTVGRTFKAQYADQREATEAKTTMALAKPAAKRTTTRTGTTKVADK